MCPEDGPFLGQWHDLCRLHSLYELSRPADALQSLVQGRRVQAGAKSADRACEVSRVSTRPALLRHDLDDHPDPFAVEVCQSLTSLGLALGEGLRRGGLAEVDGLRKFVPQPHVEDRPQGVVARPRCRVNKQVGAPRGGLSGDGHGLGGRPSGVGGLSVPQSRAAHHSPGLV